MKTTVEILEKCIATCKKCVDDCNNCADDCKDKPGMEACFKLCNDCSEVAIQCAKDCEANSENKVRSIQACIKACEDCATECEKHDNTACKKCAETCRTCAKECKSALEQKKSIWPWLLAGLAIIAGLLIWFLVFRDSGINTEAATKANEYDHIGVKENNSTVAAYINFVESNKNKMSLDHAYTNEALLKLTEAANAKANEVGYEIRADLEKLRDHANMITKDPFATTHAYNIRKATDVLTNVLQNIQKAKYPSLTDEVDELQSASASINPEMLTLEQKDAVKNYFSKASDLLQKMN